MSSAASLKPLFWMGASRKDLKSFPAEVQDEMGYALRDAQFGGQRLKAAEEHYRAWRNPR